jgi:ribosomal protein S18 acetylase RimI-like enzyme
MTDPDNEVHVEVSSPDAFSESRARALARVYRGAFGAEGYAEGEAEVARFLTDQLPKHVGRAGFRLAEATVDGRLAGFAYGYTGERGQWWSDRVVDQIPALLADEWVGGHFEFVELAVDPGVQRRGVGTLLHDELLSGLSHHKALLSTYHDDLPAPRLYRRRGWLLLVELWDGESDLYGLDLGRPSGQLDR